MPLVSIGLPVYNGERYLEESLISILKQSYKDFELIISDNSSNDQTAEICRRYSDIDSRIRYYRTDTNMGAAWNYNQVFRLSNGKYFKWAAYDDIIDQFYIEKCVSILNNRRSIVLCYAKTIMIDGQGEIIEYFEDKYNLMSPLVYGRYKQFLLTFGKRCNPIFGLIRSDILNKTPLISSYISSDHALLGELALHGQFCEIQEYLFYRRIHEAASIPANQGVEKLTIWYNKDAKCYFIVPSLRMFYEYARSILRVRMSCYDRLRCLQQLIILMAKKRYRITKELIDATYKLLNRSNTGRHAL